MRTYCSAVIRLHARILSESKYKMQKLNLSSQHLLIVTNAVLLINEFFKTCLHLTFLLWLMLCANQPYIPMLIGDMGSYPLDIDHASCLLSPIFCFSCLGQKLERLLDPCHARMLLFHHPKVTIIA